MRRTSAGGIKPPHFGHAASSDARTFLDFGGHFLSFGRGNFLKSGGGSTATPGYVNSSRRPPTWLSVEDFQFTHFIYASINGD
jgi:hypothetical protein